MLDYDLQAGDWVSPYGKGSIRDLEFLMHRDFRARFDYNWDLTITFPGEGNGWQGISPDQENPHSELRFPRTAPADGYTRNEMRLAVDRVPERARSTNSTGVTNYFLRVRSQFDVNKKLTSALYGKLLGPLKVEGISYGAGNLSFTYYLNPTSLDRNMEFDPKKNLFKNLKGSEQVNKP
jgi:hypothetical protein